MMGLGKFPADHFVFSTVAWPWRGLVARVVPSVAEDAGDVGGKVFFLITQGLAIAPRAELDSREIRVIQNKNKLRCFNGIL